MPPVKKIEILLKILSTGGSGGSSLMDTKVVVSTGGSGGSSIMDTKVVENLMDEDLGKITKDFFLYNNEFFIERNTGSWN